MGNRFSHRPLWTDDLLAKPYRGTVGPGGSPRAYGCHERWAKLAKRMLDTEHAGDDTTQVVDPEQGGCQDEGAAVDGGVLVVSGREPAPVLEAVSRMTSGRPRPSTAAWIFVLSPPRDLPSA